MPPGLKQNGVTPVMCIRPPRWRADRATQPTIPVVNTRSTGLRAKLTPAMTQHIRLQRESAKKDSTAD
jgi:hypothetical protein